MISPILKHIADLHDKPQDDLKKMWREYFRGEPPAYRKGFLIRGLAHRIQELTFGGLPPAYQQRLDALVDDRPKGKGRGRTATVHTSQDQRLLIGTRLKREYQGIAYEVTVTDGGFEYRGQRFKSLSAVARDITGTRWNGWLFFGIPNPAKQERSK